MIQHALAPPSSPFSRARPVPCWVPVRSLGQRHRARALEHLLALGEADRVLRFGHLASDERLRQYVALLDFERDAVFGVFDRRLRLSALVHLAFEADGHAAEFGVSVRPSLRGRGLGTLLFDHAVMHARNRGVRTLFIHLARDNAPMLSIVRQAGAEIAFEGAEAQAQLPLPADTLGSQLQELLGHQASDLDYRLKRQALRLDTLRSGPLASG